LYPCVSLEKPQTAGLSKLTNNDWEIERKQIRLVNKLGSGGFAQVWGGVWNGTTSVAVKTLKTGSSMTESDFLQEATLMKEFRHPNVLQLYGICSMEKPVYIITELMKHGSLLEYLRNERASLKLSQLISMAQQVAEGMAYLEELRYIHRDLAARNVLVGDGLICKISDFGLTQSVEEAKSKALDGSSTKFAIKWTAPEALLHNNFSVKSDIWSFGILLYEIITYGRFPYAGMTNEEVMRKLEQDYRMPQPKECSYTYYNIMLKCWREEPENRPSFEALQWELEEFLESMR
jgi:fyn-related kinase